MYGSARSGRRIFVEATPAVGGEDDLGLAMSAAAANDLATMRRNGRSAGGASDLLARFLRGPSWARAELAGSASALLRDEAELVAVLAIDGRGYVDPPDDPSPATRRARRIDALVGAVGEMFD